MIFGIYVVPPGYKGVKRHFGKLVGVVDPGYTSGLPFIDDLALVPEIPGVLSDLEQEVRSCDNRKVRIISDTTVIISEPIPFMRKAPDNYLEALVPKIHHSVQQSIGASYTAKEAVEKNDGISVAVKSQLEQALLQLGWGLSVKLFRYTATTDPADLITGDAAKLRLAELADAKGKREVAIVEADAAAQVQYITRKYNIDIEVYALRQEGESLAKVQEQVGLAEATVLERKLDVFASYVEKVMTTISSARKKLEPADAEIVIAYALSPIEKMLTPGKTEEAASSSAMGEIRDALLGRIQRRLEGQAEGRYLKGISADSSVNPNLALAAKVVPEIIKHWRG